MKCPNCAAEQPSGAAECGSCQIVFAKFFQKKASLQLAAAAQQASAPAGGGDAPAAAGGSFSVAAFFIGFVADIVATALSGVMLTWDLPIRPGQKLDPQVEFQFLRATLVAHLVGSFVGGFVNAMVARRAVLSNAAALALLSIVLGIGVERVMPQGLMPRWYFYLSIGLTLPAVLLGAWLKGESRD